MRTLVRTLTTIVVLIVFTSAAGLRANDTRFISPADPFVVVENPERSGFDNPLGRLERVGTFEETLPWEALELALTEFGGDFIDDGFAPSIDFGLEAFEIAFSDDEESTFGLLFPEQLETELSDLSSISELANTSGDAQALNLITAPQPLLGGNNPIVGRSATASTPTSSFSTPLQLFAFQSAPSPSLAPVLSQTIVTASFAQANVSPVPLPAALPMLLSALALFGLIRLRA